MEKYVKVPVSVVRIEFSNYVSDVYMASLKCGCAMHDADNCGYGSTEEEAFANLIEKLGYEDVK